MMYCDDFCCVEITEKAAVDTNFLVASGDMNNKHYHRNAINKFRLGNHKFRIETSRESVPPPFK